MALLARVGVPAMGSFIDKLRDAVVDNTDKVGGGFDPEVCTGESDKLPAGAGVCPLRGYKDDGTPTKLPTGCGLCGCPTIRNGLLDQTQSTPQRCRRESAHKK